MIREIRIAPRNSILFVMGEDGEAPEPMKGKLVAANPSCLTVNTRVWVDADTLVAITDDRTYIDRNPHLRCAFEGTLLTPDREVRVETVGRDRVLEMSTPDFVSRVEIWADHDFEPDHLCILVNA